MPGRRSRPQTIPSSAARPRRRAVRGTSRMRICATSVSTIARRAHSATNADRQHRELERIHRAGAEGRPAPQGTRTSQCRAAAAHCRYARSRPAYSSSGPSWIIVSSRWVSGLSTGCRPVSAIDDEREARRRQRQRRGSPRHRRPAGPRERFRGGRSCRRSARRRRAHSTNVASTNTADVRSRLAPINEKPFATVPRGHATTKRASASRPSEHERVVAEAEGGRRPRPGRPAPRPTSAAATTTGASR